MMHHRCTRTGRANDCFRLALLAYAYETLRQSAGLRSVAGIESRLAAAGLPFIKFDRAAYATQHFYRARAHRWPHLIDHACYEQRDSHEFTKSEPGAVATGC